MAAWTACTRTACSDSGIASILMPGQKAPEEHRRKDILRAAYDVAARHGVEALTVRAVAGRAAVSHGTVLFHFTRRDQLIASLLDSVLDATTTLRVPVEVERLTRPAERLQAVIDPKAFSVQQHFGSAARMLDGPAAGALTRGPM